MHLDTSVSVHDNSAVSAGRFRLSTRGWAVMACLFVFMVINFADKALLGIAATPMMEELGLTPSQYGLISSSFFFLFSISSLVVGFLTTRFRARTILIVLAVVWTIAQAVVVSPLAGFGALLVTRILLGAGEGPAYGVANHAAMQWFPRRRRGIAAAIVGIGVPAGTMVAAPILGTLVGGIGWRETFGVVALASLIWVVIWFFVGREGPFSASPSGGVQGAREAVDAEPRVPYARLLLSPTFIGCTLGGIAAYWGVVMLISWVPVYLTTVADLSPAALGWVIATPWAAQILANLVLVGLIGPRLMRRGVSSRIALGITAGSTLVLAGLAMVGFAFTTGALQLVFMIVAFGIAACVIPASQTMLGDITPTRQRGAVLGVYVAIYSVTGVIAPLITGQLVQSAESPAEAYPTVFMIAAVISIVGGVACALLSNPDRDRRRLLGTKQEGSYSA